MYTKIDEDGCITVSATCSTNVNEVIHNLLVIRHKGHYSKEELGKLTTKTKKVWVKDQKAKETGWAKT